MNNKYFNIYYLKMDLITKTYLALKNYDSEGRLDDIKLDLKNYIRNSDIDEDRAIEMIEESGEIYDALPIKLQRNFDVALTATQSELVPYMDYFKNDLDIANSMFRDNCQACYLERSDLIKDREWVFNFLDYIKYNNNSISALLNCRGVFIDEEILKKAKSYLDYRFRVPYCEYFINDKEVALKIFSHNTYNSLSKCPFKDDPEFIKKLLNLKINYLWAEDIIKNCVVDDEIKDLIMKKWKNDLYVANLLRAYKKW